MVDHSAEFAAALEHFPSTLAGFDDAVILQGGTTALVTGADGEDLNGRHHDARGSAAG